VKRWISILSLLALVQGCASHFAPTLQLQDSSIVPRDGEPTLAPHDLEPGDIVLTSMPTLLSAGIQLVTFAPVSHAAVYIGDQQVAEAVGSGVRVRAIDKLLEEEAVVLVLRYPGLSARQARDVRAFTLSKVGTDFNYLGVAAHMPFALNRRLCELPLTPEFVRDACIRGFGSVYQLASSRGAFFCSQFVLQAYREAGVPITDADPRLVSPADILHMREGDVPSVRVRRPLRYVGHLKYGIPTAVALGN
jgi:hypothetical protein